MVRSIGLSPKQPVHHGNLRKLYHLEKLVTPSSDGYEKPAVELATDRDRFKWI